MKILVTGGAGFIGSNFIYHMLGKYPDCRIVCLDKLTYAGNLRTLFGALKDGRFRFVRGDIADGDFVYRLFGDERFDAVVNFAAESHVDRSIVNARPFLVTNIIGTQVLLDACNRYGVGRFHQISTDEVYGDLPIERGDLRFTENSPLRPSSPYAASKASADLLVQAYCRTYGTFATISRCSNNYGPYQFPEKLIPLMITHALAGKSLPVYGDGKNVRDWLHVSDHCRAIDAILRGGRSGEVYNVGGRCELPNTEVVKRILGLLNKPENLIEFVADRKGHDRRYATDCSKTESELGWKAETDFSVGLEQTVRWYLDNRSWWEEILSGEYKKYEEGLSDGR